MQLTRILLFIIGFTFTSCMAVEVVIPTIATQHISVKSLQKDGIWSRIKKIVHSYFELLKDRGVLIAVIAHIPILGLIVAIVMNAGNKSELAEFYIKQVAGLSLIGLLIGLTLGLVYFVFLTIISSISVVGFVALLVIWYMAVSWGIVSYLGLFIFLIMSLLSATKGEQKELPVVGELFQKWFSRNT